MEVFNLKCTSCGAPIEGINGTEAISVCPYCGSMLYLMGCAVSEKSEQSETGPSESMHIPLCCVAKDLIDNAALKEVINGMSDVLDENTSSDTIIPILNTILRGKKEAATKESFPNDYFKAESIIKNIMHDGESLIFFKTAALFGFNKLKTGMFVTSERVGYIDGKKVFYVEYSDLDSLLIDIAFESSTYWYPNGNEKIFMSALAVDNREFGAIIAYIVLRTYEKSNQNKSVVLGMLNNQ